MSERQEYWLVSLQVPRLLEQVRMPDWRPRDAQLLAAFPPRSLVEYRFRRECSMTAFAERSASQVVEKLPVAPLHYRSDKIMQATSYSEEPSEQRVRAFPTPRRKTTKALQVSNDTKT